MNLKTAALFSLVASIALGTALAQAADPRRELNAFAARPGSVEEYVIGAHDLLEISVFELKDLTGERRVESDGTISLPLLGKVAVGGLTPQQAEDSIAQMLRERDLVKNPQVTVFVKEYISRSVSVQGAVAKPDVYEMLGQRTLLDMIGMAGGLNDRAGRTIFILRPFAPAGQDKLEIDAEELIFEGNSILNVLLQPGDIVSIPYARELRVYVSGAVRQPGMIKYPDYEAMTVLQAVTSAGGVSERGNESRTHIIRRHPDGTKQIIKVNLKRVKRGKADDVMLQENDIVNVPESFF